MIFSNLLVANQPIYGTLPAQGEHEVIHCLLAKRLQAVLAGWEVVHSSRVFEKTWKNSVASVLLLPRGHNKWSVGVSVRSSDPLLSTNEEQSTHIVLLVCATNMLRVQARPSSGESEDIDAAGETKFCNFWAKTDHLKNVTARDDLMKLQRQFRVTEGSRKQYADLAQSTLRKQQWDDHHTHSQHVPYHIPCVHTYSYLVFII